jgi:hypothetical protein
MGISDWFKRLRAREDANAIERFEERREQEGDLPEGERFLADEDRVGRGVDEEIVKGVRWETLPTEDDSYPAVWLSRLGDVLSAAASADRRRP